MRELPFEYAIRNLGRSPGRLLMSAAGSAIVVLLVMAAGGFIEGMDRALRTSGSDRNAILLGAGSEESIERSEIPMRTPGIAAASIAGVARIAGVDAVSPEIHAALPVIVAEAADDGPTETTRETAANTVVRGVRPEAFLVHREVRVIAGRTPETGGDEVAIGRLAARGLGFDPPTTALDASLVIDDRPFRLVGVLAADGGVVEGEVWMPLSDLLIVSQRDTLSCVALSTTTTDHRAIEAFAATRLDLELAALRESEYYAALSDFFGPVRLMVTATAVLVAAGGVVGGLNTTYAAFASRTREIGTLRTLGFGRGAILRSFVVESILTAATGGIIAAFVARELLDGLAIRFSMGVFGIAIGPEVVAVGLLSGLVLGIVGAVLPAWRCLRLPVPEALRSA